MLATILAPANDAVVLVVSLHVLHCTFGRDDCAGGVWRVKHPHRYDFSVVSNEFEKALSYRCVLLWWTGTLFVLREECYDRNRFLVVFVFVE